MAYFGRTRQIRLEYAEATYRPPVWVEYVHPRRALIDSLKREFPNVKTWVIEDERSN